MKKIEIGKIKVERISLKNIDDNSIFIQENQTTYINNLFMDEEFSCKGLLIKELERKINSYKQQDKLKKIFNPDIIINLSNLIEKLVSSKLKCVYCRENMSLFYKNIREEYQWTLDRINNDLGHSCENTLISCLKCNLQRRRRGMAAFKFTKELRIKKSS
jgi:hypothetical protein